MADALVVGELLLHDDEQDVVQDGERARDGLEPCRQSLEDAITHGHHVLHA